MNTTCKSRGAYVRSRQIFEYISIVTTRVSFARDGIAPNISNRHIWHCIRTYTYGWAPCWEDFGSDHISERETIQNWHRGAINFLQS